jgi:hypothetical protein
LRDRAVWIIATVALGVVVYLVFPLWVVVAASVLIIGLRLLARRAQRQRARR